MRLPWLGIFDKRLIRLYKHAMPSFDITSDVDHQELDTRAAAANGIEFYWIKVKKSGGLEQTMVTASSYWRRERAVLLGR